MNSADIREGYLRFFEGYDHLRLASAPLLSPDRTLLFTAAGMVPLKQFYLGEVAPPSPRMTSDQKCIRTNDIERVGRTARHHTFFEMLGNFSIGNYFKDDAIAMAYEYSTKVLGLSADRIWVTIYEDDLQTADIWQKVGIPRERIVPMGADDNFWTMGPVGPCGPCSELYIDRGVRHPGDENQQMGDEGDRFLEYWNLVFTQFDRQPDGSLKPLARKNIDTGLGLERMTSIIEDTDTDFETDGFQPIIQTVADLSHQEYGGDPRVTSRMKTIADHVRACTFLMAENLLPSNEKQGYVLRRLLRRSQALGRMIGIEGAFMGKVADTVIDLMKGPFPELVAESERIKRDMDIEEQRFDHTLREGLVEFTRAVEAVRRDGSDTMPGKTAFYLHDTMGFPIELTADLLRDAGLELDREGFDVLLNDQRHGGSESSGVEEASRERTGYIKVRGAVGTSHFVGYETLSAEAVVTGLLKGGESASSAQVGDHVGLVLSSTPFYGEKGGQVGDTGVITTQGARFEVTDTKTPVEGLIIHEGVLVEGAIAAGDTARAEVDPGRRKAIARAHTATHLLQAALRSIDPTVRQKGSKVMPDEFHFDFSFRGSLGADDRKALEEKVLGFITANAVVRTDVMPIEEAHKTGALAFFGEKYGEAVRVVAVDGISKELCGGTHVTATGNIGFLHIRSMRSIGTDTKRIEASVGLGALQEFWAYQEGLERAAGTLNCGSVPAEVTRAVEDLTALVKERDRRIEGLIAAATDRRVRDLIAQPATVKGQPVVVATFEGLTAEALRSAGDMAEQQLGDGVFIGMLSGGDGFTVIKVFGTASATFSARDIFKALTDKVGGKGGGNDRMCQGRIAGLPTAEELEALLG
ncbi:MAG: alanine--tRNA ligase [Caldiserica bacterium]|nr:alanine--tRNA ligase [Caldisericota bacterium]